jgi:hypothetical protein
MLKHLARMRPMNRAVICPVTTGRLVHEADFARALMLWQRRKFEAITLRHFVFYWRPLRLGGSVRD